LATFISGAVLLGLGYLFVDRRLGIQERADRERDEEEVRGELRAGALALVGKELTSNAASLQVWRTVLTTTGNELPNTGFDVNGWALVTQAHVLTTLRPTTIDALMHVYNRMRSANDHRELLGDLTYGQSALGIATAIANTSVEHSVLPAPVATLRDRFEEHVGELRGALVGRLDDLKPLLDNAIDAVEQEHGTYEGVPAAERSSVGVTPPIRVN
jgi:hypothetical protein